MKRAIMKIAARKETETIITRKETSTLERERVKGMGKRRGRKKKKQKNNEGYAGKKELTMSSKELTVIYWTVYYVQ